MKLKSAPGATVLLLLTLFVSSAAFGATATVNADFANRSNSAHRIPPRMFGINLAAIQSLSTASLLNEAGISEGRRFANIPVVYAKTTPDWSAVDWAMNQARAAGIHPIVVMTNTPSWLQPSSTPCASASTSQFAPPTNIGKWAAIAAAYVAHLDHAFPGLVQDYEIWNEPELQQSLCVADNTDATRLKTYLSLYAAAASAMRATANQDGVSIRIGGPTISRLALAPMWISALLSNPQTAPNVDFVSFHFYPTGLKQIQDGMNWSALYTRTQSNSDGLPFYYSQISSLVKKGSQPHPSSTPIYITEYNSNWAFTPDCCRNHPSYAPLWNATAVVDLLNSVYAGANPPGKIYYYSGHMPPFCMFGTWNGSMDCNSSQMEPYPQYYLYQLLASSTYLGLQEGGYMAASVSPGITQSGLMATAFYTPKNDALVIVNPTATHYAQTTVILKNPGFGTTQASLHLLDAAHGQISTQSLNLSSGSDGLSATIDVPAYSTVALAITGSTSVATTAASDFSMDASQIAASNDKNTYTLTIKPDGILDLPVSLSCNQVPPTKKCLFTPAVVTPGSHPVTSTLSIVSLVASTRSRPWDEKLLFALAYLSLPVLGLAIGFSSTTHNKKHRRMLLICGIFAGLALHVACGGTSYHPSPGSNNPSAVVVRASSGDRSHLLTIYLKP